MDEILHITRPVLQLGERLLTTGIDLTVSGGEVVCITGESGCGKTSLLRAIMGFVPLVSGSVSICGQTMSHSAISRMRQHTAYIPQELNPPIEWVHEMVALPYSLRANSHLRPDSQRMFTLWQRMGLESKLYEQRVNELSGGQRARIVLATAMMMDKPLLIADEPTAALDGETSLLVASILREHAAQHGTAVLVVSHDDTMSAQATRTIHMAKA